MKLFFLFTITLIFSFTVHSQTPKTEAWTLSLISGSFKINDVIERRSIAKNFEKNIKSLNSNIPSLTKLEAEEIKRIEKSLNHKDIKKIKEKFKTLVKMHTYHQKVLKEKLSTIEKSLECAGSINSSETQEMYCWALANYYLTESQTMNFSLNQLHDIKGFSFSKQTQNKHMIKLGTENPWWFYHNLGRAIQEKIIVRYLSSLKYNK